MANQVKQEVKQEIKTEDGILSGSPMEEDDVYEDDLGGDLEFPNPADAFKQQIYMCRVPNYLWQAWADLPDDAEIEIGRLRQFYDENKQVSATSRSCVVVF